ncbi:MAG: response regulator [Bdellovibrionaceae bacterium]|nr:response regulator [Pseudobdellovibrionaceae bacterium]
MTENPNAHPKLVSFLLVEDDDDHAQLVIRSLARNRITNQVHHVRDGAEAIDFLYKRGRYELRQLPDIILLDLKLPKIDGHEVLRRIKGDPLLKVIPVVILTTSAAEQDRSIAYESYANSYLVKPLDFNSFRKMAEDLNLYWGVWNQPPHMPRG